MKEKLEMKSSNIVKDHIKEIQKLFPNAVTEVQNAGGATLKVDLDILKQELSDELIDERQERYQMTWPDKKKSMLLANTRINATLRPDKEKSVDFDNTKNIYIEGDNLDVLKLLRETYLGKVKMIYIDPPYNTGNDFVYEDDFSQGCEEYLQNSGQYDEQGNRLHKNQETNGRFHTDWLNMMYPRLKIARDLLSDDGVIFISIDDNEQANLKKICDEIFGSNNFRSIVTVIANPGGRDYGGIAKTSEYILVYTKFPETLIKKVPDESHVFEMKDDIGPFELRELRNRNTVFNINNRPNLYYPFYLDPNNVDEFGLYHLSLEEDTRHIVKVTPLISNGIQTVWRWGKEEKSRKNLNINIKGKLKQDGSYMIVEKYRDENIMVKNTWIDKKFRTENGSVQVREILGKKGIFSYPKPIEISYLAAMMCTDKDSIVLDFFSGSATTAHAIMKLNAEDNGNRKFVMVQLPEICSESSEANKAGYKTICDIGEERIRRAGKKIKEENPNAANLDIGFRVLRLDSSNMNDVYYNAKETIQSLFDSTINNVKAGRTPLDLLFQVMLELGVELSSKIEEKEIKGKKYFVVNENDIVAFFDEGITNEIITELAKIKPLYVVFCDGAFESDYVNINTEQIFKSISPSTTIKVL